MKSYISRKFPLETRITAIAFDGLLMREFQNAPQRITRNQEFLICRNNPDPDARVSDLSCVVAFGFVSLAIYCDSQRVEIRADLFSDDRRILADSAGKDQNVRAVHRRKIFTDIFPRPIAKSIYSQRRPFIA